MSVQVTPDIYSSAITYFSSGVSIPAGTYRIYYINGAFQAASKATEMATWCVAEDWNYNMLEYIVNVSGAGYSPANGTYYCNYYHNPSSPSIDDTGHLTYYINSNGWVLNAK